MDRLRKIWKKPFLTIFALTCSCSIIQEGDITSPDQLSDLKLTSFEIIQSTSNGSSTATAKLDYDSVQNFIDPNTGTKITRKVEYTLAALGNLKMKFRSGATTGTRIYVYYTDTKKVYTLGVIQQDSVVELYRFRYSSSGQLNKIVTFIDPINKPLTVATNDTLIYAGNTIKKLTRRYSGSSTSIDITYNTSGSNAQDTYVSILSNGYNNNCSNNNSSGGDCSNYSNTQGQNTGGVGPEITISAAELLDKLSQLNLQDRRVGFTNQSNTFHRELDTFYFHPTMLLRNQLSQGNHLLVIYMMDWWSLGAMTATSNFSRDDYVTLNYGYGR